MRTRPTVKLLIAAAPLRGGVWMMVGLLGGVVTVLALAAEAPGERTARLGFRFDQQAHDAAVAARQKGGTRELDPAEPNVVRLPEYRVQESRIELDEDELLTPEGRVALAKKRHLAPVYQKVSGPLAAVAALLHHPLGGWNPNGREAMALYEEERTLQRRKETADLTDLAAEAARVNRPKERPAKSPGTAATTTR